MKCWHCGHKTRSAESAFIKFAVGGEGKIGFDIWQEKQIWLCSYCAQNLRKWFNRQKQKAIKPIIKELESKRE